MKPDDTERGMCWACGTVMEAAKDRPPDEPRCVGCGEPLTAYQNLAAADKVTYRLQDWFGQVVRKGMNGPSPGGAASMLGCHRSMIDKLVDRGILEKNVYDRDGHFIVLISRRSLLEAKKNKEKTGKWTDSGDEP